MKLDTPALASLDMKGKRVLVRVDFNVPIDDDGTIRDDTRIRCAIPTIEQVLAAGGLPILMSHLGRPDGVVVEKLRLAPVGVRLAELMGHAVVALKESVGASVAATISDAKPGTILLLENVRFHAGETKGDAELSKSIAALGDVFVNDAFGSSHRDHCSVSGVARLLPSAAGLLLQAELQAFQRVLEKPERPLVAILGGAKVADKLTVIDNLLDKVDKLIVGGGMAYTFLKAMGHSVGTSLVQDEQLEMVQRAMGKAADKGVELLLPVDHECGAEFSGDTKVVTTEAMDIPDGLMGLDIGPKSRAAFVAAAASAKTLVWNGPMGVFEWPAFQKGTEEVGRAVAGCAGYTVVGGGDSVAAIAKFELSDRIDHVSTGGGASLELLEGRDLPGVSALSNA